MDGKQYDLAGEVIGAAMKVHRILGPGFLEAVYANALSHELKAQGVAFDREQPLTVTYNGAVVGSYLADFVLGDSLIIEVKAISALAKAHEAQLVNYLAATGIETGLLLNFGTSSLEFRRRQRTLRPPNSQNSVNSV